VRRQAFKTLLIDPPWNETGGTAKSKAFGAGPRGADVHYPTMKTKEIPEVIKGSGMFRPAPDSHLYLWSSKSFVPDALWVMDQLGFRYVTMLTWAKSDKRFGLGRYFRGKTEPLLFGVRGKGLDVCTEAKNIDDLIIAPRSTHSRKPVEAYQKIEARSLAPFVEIFGRGAFGRPGWEIWGNEAITQHVPTTSDE